MVVSFGFPKMLGSTESVYVTDKEAIRQDMYLLLASECNTLFGDPYYGCQLKKYIYEQASSIIPDLLIDHIYTTVSTFMPQVRLNRKDIDIFVSRNTLCAKIAYSYVLDNTSDLFTIKLNESTEEI